MKTIELDCIVCPMSCHLFVSIENQNVVNVEGNTCPRGRNFAHKEVTCPTRMVTTTIKIRNAIHPLLPVITAKDVSKDKIFDIMEVCKHLEVETPIMAGEVIVKNIADSGVDLLASRTME